MFFIEYEAPIQYQLYSCPNTGHIKHKHCKLLPNVLHLNLFSAVYKMLTYLVISITKQDHTPTKFFGFFFCFKVEQWIYTSLDSATGILWSVMTEMVSLVHLSNSGVKFSEHVICYFNIQLW